MASRLKNPDANGFCGWPKHDTDSGTDFTDNSPQIRVSVSKSGWAFRQLQNSLELILFPNKLNFVTWAKARG